MLVDHIAFVTNHLETITDMLPPFCKPFPVEDQPAEGTREQYVEIADEAAPMLLLMQPVNDGPYLRALNKRGPGLHHIGGVTPSIAELLPRIQQSGLLLHPISLKTYENRVIWLCRPGVPFLIELVERPEQGSVGSTECSLHLPATLSVPGFITDFFTNLTIQNSEDGQFHITADSREIALNVV